MVASRREKLWLRFNEVSALVSAIVATCVVVVLILMALLLSLYLPRHNLDRCRDNDGRRFV